MSAVEGTSGRLLPAFALSALARSAWGEDAPSGDVALTTGVVGQIGEAPSAADFSRALLKVHPRYWRAGSAPGLWLVQVDGGGRIAAVDLGDRGVLIALPFEVHLLGCGWAVEVFVPAKGLVS